MRTNHSTTDPYRSATELKLRADLAEARRVSLMADDTSIASRAAARAARIEQQLSGRTCILTEDEALAALAASTGGSDTEFRAHADDALRIAEGAR